MKLNFTRLFSFLLLTVFVYTNSSCKKDGSDPAPTNPPSTPPTNNPPVTDTTKLHGWIVTTFAGTNVRGNVDGDSTQARFMFPTDMTQDADGNLYVIDPSAHNIRMITPSAKVSTYHIENLAAGDTLSDAVSLTTDGHGNIYVVRHSYHIRKITVAGASVFAGNYMAGFKDGQDTSARFNSIMNLTCDRQGNLYLGDHPAYPYYGNNMPFIRKVTPSALVSTLALTDNTGYDYPTSESSSIVADSVGNIYFTVAGSSLIKKADPQGIVTVFAGSPTAGFKDGKGVAAQFNTIVGMAVDASGNLWVSDLYNSAVRKVTPDGTVTTIAGNGTTGYANGDSATARFKHPEAISVGKKGEIYLLDSENYCIRKLVYYP